jgi:hypothetical protein
VFRQEAARNGLMTGTIAVEKASTVGRNTIHEPNQLKLWKKPDE